MATRLRVVIYCRVSGDAQERDGTSLETQERACRDLVSEGQHYLVDCIKEVGSGYTLDRDGLSRVRQMVRDGVVDIVVSLELDRLSREQFHTYRCPVL